MSEIFTKLDIRRYFNTTAAHSKKKTKVN